MSWPTNDRVRAREDGNINSSQIGILTGLENQSVIGNLSTLKPYGRPNVEKLGFTWERDKYDQLYLTPERAALYTREILLPIMRRRGGRVALTETFLMGAKFPTKDEENQRDNDIVAAMEKYTGRRTKRCGWPWLRDLRIESGMSDITSSDRRRLWPLVSANKE